MRKDKKALVAVALAVVMGTVTMGTAFAAGNAEDACEHFIEVEERGISHGIEINSMLHDTYMYCRTYCYDCNELLDEYVYYSGVDEQDMSGYENGMWKCTVCDYLETPGGK